MVGLLRAQAYVYGRSGVIVTPRAGHAALFSFDKHFPDKAIAERARH